MNRPHASAFSLIALALVPAAASAQTVISGTTTDNTNTTAFTISAAGSSYVLNAGTTYQLRSATDGQAIRVNAANVTFSVQGSIVNEALLSADSDAAALRITGAANSGLLINIGSATNSAASVLSKGNDAIKFTAVGTSAVAPNVLNNYGSIRSEGRVSTSGGTANTYIASDAITMGVNTALNNYGTISGARHGVDGGAITGVTVNNYAGGTIVGRNGSGIGADTTSAVAADYVVYNWGTIRGDYAGSGNIYDRANAASVNGDGDGIDIDGAATIRNYSTGQILSTGGGGFDSGGRSNNSEAISIGGGVIVNDGVIRGADRGIIVNNDSIASRSGSAAMTITNNAGAIIEGQNGFAIRLENKLGTAADNDTIINAGTIIGNGAIPDPTAIVNTQTGTADANSVGTLDGVSYTGTGVARFIRGDGAAIQMGEGNDTLTNTGTITGNTGRAVSMEGGDDTVNYNAGTITGSIDGGTGNDTLNLGAGVSAASAVSNFETVNVSTGTATISGVVSGTTLIKGGVGALILSNANTHTGNTTVSAGALRITNTTGSATGNGNVIVSSGARFEGNGTASGNATLSGILAPGISVGNIATLTVGGDFTWNGGGAGNAWQFDLGLGNTSDRLLIGDDFFKGTGLGGQDFVFDFLNGGSTGTFILAQWTGTTNFSASDFSYINAGAGVTGSFAINGNQLEFTAVPEPATYAAMFGAAVLGLAFWRRRRAA